MALPLLYSNETKYRGILETCVTRINEGENKFEQVGIMNMPDRLRVATQVLESTDKARMSLVFPKQKEDEEPEEVVLRLQAYLVQAHLPPILNRQQLGKTRYEHARQSVTLTGLGTEPFNQALLAILKIHQHFQDNCAEGQVDNWVTRKDRGHPVLTVGNRYLSVHNPGTSVSTVLPLDDIDPFHILRKAVPDACHTRENQVLYFEKLTRAKKPSYQAVRPMAIRAGQLVEVQLGFMTVRIKKGRYVFLPTLRSICILDRTLLDDLTTTTLQELRSITPSTAITLKRRVGYEEKEGEGSMSSQLKRLRMDVLDEMDVTEQAQEEEL